MSRNSLLETGAITNMVTNMRGNKYGRVKLLGRVSKKSEKVLRRVFKKVGKVQVELNKIRLKFNQGKMIVNCEKLSDFSRLFLPNKIHKNSIYFGC